MIARYLIVFILISFVGCTDHMPKLVYEEGYIKGYAAERSINCDRAREDVVGGMHLDLYLEGYLDGGVDRYSDCMKGNGYLVSWDSLY